MAEQVHVHLEAGLLGDSVRHVSTKVLRRLRAAVASRKEPWAGACHKARAKSLDVQIEQLRDVGPELEFERPLILDQLIWDN